MMQPTRAILSAICVATLAQAAPQPGQLDKSKSCEAKREFGSDVYPATPATLADISTTAEGEASAIAPTVYYGVNPCCLIPLELPF